VSQVRGFQFDRTRQTDRCKVRAKKTNPAARGWQRRCRQCPEIGPPKFVRIEEAWGGGEKLALFALCVAAWPEPGNGRISLALAHARWNGSRVPAAR
jgi:hypothetical protein